MNDDYYVSAKELVSRMTLEEKAFLLTGDGWWATFRIDRLGIPSISITDGPHGVRKGQGAGLVKSVPATCFPTASALASSWNSELMRRVGVALGLESQASDVQILLGPGVNMKRSPLGGRNFEYFSEDPLLAGKMAAAYIEGVQSQGVGTSLKHYAVNNQEFERMATNSNVDERTLNETWGYSFHEIAGLRSGERRAPPFLIGKVLPQESPRQPKTRCTAACGATRHGAAPRPRGCVLSNGVTGAATV